MPNMLSPLCCPRILTQQGPVACVQERCAWWVNHEHYSGCAESVQAQAAIDQADMLAMIAEELKIANQEANEGGSE